jgi:ClpX C4-type zinc finger
VTQSHQPARGALSYSFCGKTEAQVLRLFTGPRALICNECVALLARLLTDDERAGGPPPPPDKGTSFIGPWRPTPHQRSKASKR